MNEYDSACSASTCKQTHSSCWKCGKWTCLQFYSTIVWSRVCVFFSGHLRCLKKLNEADNLCENAVQEVLAVHLFGPLAMENSRIRVDSSRYKGNADTKCRFCDIKVPTSNTSFGKYKHVSPAKGRERNTFWFPINYFCRMHQFHSVYIRIKHH